MEWVETTGNTLEEAREAALDELGVDEAEAEFEVLQQPKVGLFGRIRAEARIRARVRPTAPRAKEDRRDRRRSRSRDAGPKAASPDSAPAADHAGPAAGDDSDGISRPRRRRSPSRAGAATAGDTVGPVSDVGTVEAAGSTADPGAVETAEEIGDGSPTAPSAPAADGNGTDGPDEGRVRRNRGRSGRNGGPSSGAAEEAAGAGERPRRDATSRSNDRAGEGPTVEVALEEQGRIAEEFLQGLVTQFGLEAEIKITQPDEDNVNLAVHGQGLGLLIGPKGATLLAIQDLTRTVVQRKTGASNGRIHVDVGGYREKRAAALANFARQVATQVVESGTRRALEPMAAADRKVVHDTLNEVEGVQTISEGEEPQRRVVIVPAS